MEGLNPREEDVLNSLCDGELQTGYANSEIVASSLVIGVYTARNHIQKIYDKTGVHNRTQLAVIAYVQKTNSKDT